MIDEKKILNCNADESNSFYGNQGALKCMHEEGELAILELQYLKGTQSFQVFVGYLALGLLRLCTHSQLHDSHIKHLHSS